jgi:hypothetical protein
VSALQAGEGDFVEIGEGEDGEVSAGLCQLR